MVAFRSRQAFTLPELLLTALILSYSLSVILSTYVNCIALNEASRNLTTATSHAEFIIEDIRSTSFAGIAAAIDDGDWDWDMDALEAKGLAPLKNEVTSVSSSGTDLLDITVTINWEDLKGRSRSKAFRTQISA